MLSSSGDNMVNIKHMKNKSVGIIRQIFNKLESLNLQKYHFECAIIFMNCMLRSSILLVRFHTLVTATTDSCCVIAPLL